MNVLTAVGTIMVSLSLYHVTFGSVIQEVLVKVEISVSHEGRIAANHGQERPPAAALSANGTGALATGSSPIDVTSPPTTTIGEQPWSTSTASATTSKDAGTTAVPTTTQPAISTSTAELTTTTTSEPTTTATTSQPTTTTTEPTTTTTNEPTTTTTTSEPTTTTTEPTTTTTSETTTTTAEPTTTTTSEPTTTTAEPITTTEPSPTESPTASPLDADFLRIALMGECRDEGEICSSGENLTCTYITDCPLLHLCCPYTCGNRCVAPARKRTLMGSEDTTSFGFVIDLWFNQFSTETYSNIVTAIWDRIRWETNPPSVNVMVRSFSTTRTDPNEADFCELYRQLETLNFDFPALKLQFDPFSRNKNVLYIITGSDSYHFFRLLSPLKRIFDSLCYVVVDDTSLENYNMIATEENGEPCVLTLEQLARHGFTSEDFPPRPNCKRRNSACSKDSDCGTLALTCVGGTCQPPDCAPAAGPHPRCRLDSDSELYQCDYNTSGSASSVISELLKHQNFPFTSDTTEDVPGCCDNGQVLCHEFPLRCVDREKVCDTTFDCITGEDEHFNTCDNRVCREDEFRCTSGQCVPQHKRCDTRKDCADESDEKGCSQVECNFSPAFQCVSGQCVPEVYQCDGQEQCVDGSDEEACA
ncbi:uncharacterized protein [Penaeus vannamei]|uniref:uncharacterized protein n=1 Tax=Penaeus vannamei TaxID=6689 RepID=UPI00387F398E